ncbi:MAG: beta strand repeat-containing protein, partial [Thermoleophilia bacterium]
YCTCVFGYTLPTAPNLTADKTTSTWYATADVTFTNIAGFGPGGVQYYRYSWDQTPTHSFTDTETQWSSGTLTKTSLVTGSWYLHVKSYNSEGASNGTVDYGPYYYDGVAPTGLANQAPLNGAVDQATSVSVESGTATDSGSGQIQYYFEVARDSGFTTGLQASGWQSVTSFAPALDNATTYYWHVKARDGVLNETSYTAAWSFTTTDVPPAAPSIGTPAALSATSIRWSFTDNAGNETGFRVHDALDNIKASSASPDLGYLDEVSLTANTQYTRHIHAYNAIGDSAGSGDATIYTLPTAPNLTADKTTSTWYATADVTFTNIADFGPGGVQYYRYSWDQTPTYSFTDTETQWSSGTLVQTANLNGGWYLHVKSYNADDAAGSTVDYGPYNYDGSAPSVTSFTATTPSGSLNIPIESFAATDNIAVTGYQITTSTAPPAAGGGDWSGSAPSTYTVASEGTYTLYPWAKDAAGNVSLVFGTPRTVLVDTTPLTVELTTPDNDDAGVALDENVTIDFSEDVDCSTVNTTNITISSGGWALSSCSGDDAVFSTSGQSNNTVYTVTVSTAVTDANGNPMDSSHQFSYTTVAASGGSITVCATGCDFTTIQGAISDPGTLDGETIQVSSGTYSENINFSGKDITVESVSGAAATKIQGTGGNSAVVTFAGGETSSAVLDGFTIDNQAAAGTASRGISITASSSPTISDSVIEGNLISTGQNGAGIYISAGGATIENSTIGTVTSPNNSAGNAGGIYLTGGSGLSISGSTISYNVASSHGGGIYATGTGGALSITGSTISYNQAGLSGPGIYLTGKTVATTISGTTINNNTSVQAGGGIYSNGSPLSISGSTIRNNTVSSAGQNGAGLYLTGAAATTSITSTDFTSNSASSAGGGGIYVAGDADLTFSGGSLNGNIAGSTSGGAIFASGAGTTVNISGANIRGNDVAQYGGGIYIASTAQVTLTNCIVSGNTADGFTYSDGGGIYNNGSTMNIMNSTFAGNYARRNGGGTYGAGTITNSIIWGNTAGTSGAQIYGTPTVTYSDIQGGFAGTGNINSDPLFVSLVQATLGNPTTAGDYHISIITSPVVDAGTGSGAPASDIDGNSRPQGLGYDMGADEFM